MISSRRLTHHRTVGLSYIAISLVAVFVGTVLSLLMRIHLSFPDAHILGHGIIRPEDYLALVTMHGTIMLFFVLTVAPQSGFSNIILPAQIGAREMAFPRVNFAAMVLTGLSLLILLAAFFVPQGAPISGWTAYPPFSASALTGPGQGLGMDLWLLSLALFAIASTAGAVNTITTIVKLRCEGMTWERLPLTVWAWLTAALLSILAFSVLAAAVLLLCCDRHLHTAFFLPSQQLLSSQFITHHSDGSPLLWMHLFWFFGHPEVYIAILPGMGLTSMVLANFAHRQVFAYRLMIVTTLLIGFLGIMVWGHHMFVSGMNPFAGTAFSISSIAIALPSTAKVLSWLATVWGSRPRFTTPMLFALGFVSLFIMGGLSGPILAQPILDEYLHNTFFVVAHFHLIMAMAGIFGIFCGIYYWFPVVFARQLSERLGKWHFWLTLIGSYTTFLPMHLAGLAGEPRHYAQLTGMPGPAAHLLAATSTMQLHITFGAFFLSLAQIPFVVALFLAMRTPPLAHSDIWEATTLEFAPPTIWAPDAELAVSRGPCHYTDDGNPLPQWQTSPTTNPAAE
ncbi:MAG: cbb3-type cytochrome c oxidase subunit I [Acidobacteriaceae bacterium]